MEKISDLENKRLNILKERRRYIAENKHRWKTISCNGNTHVEYDTESNLPTPKPADNGKGKFGAQVLKRFDEAISLITQKIDEIKNGRG